MLFLLGTHHACVEGTMPAAPGRSHALYAQATFVQLCHGNVVLTTAVFAVSLPSAFMESSMPVCDRARVPLRVPVASAQSHVLHHVLVYRS